MNNLKKGAIVSYIAIFFNIVAGFLYTPWMISAIGKSEYGLYTLATSFLSYFMLDFGMENAITKFVSKYRAEDKENEIANILGIIIKVYLALDIIMLIAFIIVGNNLGSIFTGLSQAELSKFSVVFKIASITSLINFPFIPLKGIMKSYEEFFALKIFDLLQKMMSIFLTVLILLVYPDLYILVLVNLAVSIISIALKMVYIKKKINLKINIKYFDFDMIKNIFSFSFWVSFIMLAQQLIVNLTPTLLGILSPNAAQEIAEYSIGMTIYGYFNTFSMALNGLFLPKVTRMLTKQATSGNINDFTLKVGKIQMFIMGLLLCGFTALGQEFVAMWVGEDYKISYFIALMMVIPLTLVSTQEVATTILIVRNEIKYRAYVYTGAAVAVVFLSLILIPRYGLIGAGVSVGISMFIFHVICMNWVYKKVLGLQIKEFWIKGLSKQVVTFLLTITMGILLNTIFDKTLCFFALKVVVISVIYASCSWFTLLSTQERKEYFRKIVMKRR